MNNRPFVLAISGVKDSGKTTLIESILPYITGRGLRVAVIKHHGHGFSADAPGTDTYRHFEAGAFATALISDGAFMTVQRKSTDENEMIAAFHDADLILLEGYKSSRWPKIVVQRTDGGAEAYPFDLGTVLAVAVVGEGGGSAADGADCGASGLARSGPAGHPEAMGGPARFDANDHRGIADFIVGLMG
jgi:molybdopterin-guanine dinucleotide biosynthesis protein B